MAGLAEDKAIELAETFRLLGDPSRLRIVLSCLDGPMRPGQIAEQLALSPSLVSHHLRLLKAARLLRGERRGKQMLYALADEHIRCVLEDMVSHVCENGPEPDDTEEN